MHERPGGWCRTSTDVYLLVSSLYYVWYFWQGSICGVCVCVLGSVAHWDSVCFLLYLECGLSHCEGSTDEQVALGREKGWGPLPVCKIRTQEVKVMFDSPVCYPAQSPGQWGTYQKWLYQPLPGRWKQSTEVPMCLDSGFDPMGKTEENQKLVIPQSRAARTEAQFRTPPLVHNLWKQWKQVLHSDNFSLSLPALVRKKENVNQSSTGSSKKDEEGKTMYVVSDFISHPVLYTAGRCLHKSFCGLTVSVGERGQGWDLGREARAGILLTLNNGIKVVTLYISLM